MNKKLILFAVVAISLTSCGLSEEARQLEETNLELANRLRRAESVVIPAMQGHIENLEEAVDANREVQNQIDSAYAVVERAANDLDAVVAAIPESVTTPLETVLPEQLPKTEDETTPVGLVESQREDIERTHRHNQDAGTMREILNKLDEIGESVHGAEETLQSASQANRDVTDAVSDEIVEISNTTETIADEIASASSLADDAAARARSIRDKADIANIVGGALSTALGNLPIPGMNFVAGSFQQPDTVVPRSPYNVPSTPADGDSGFPYWLIPVLLGGGGAPFLSKTVRGGVGKVFGRGSKTTTTQTTASVPKGPGQSSDARFLGEALMRLEAQEQAEREASSGPDMEDRLAQILNERRQRRAVDDSRLRSVQQKSPAITRGTDPGQSGVFSMPTDRVG